MVSKRSSQAHLHHHRRDDLAGARPAVARCIALVTADDHAGAGGDGDDGDDNKNEWLCKSQLT